MVRADCHHITQICSAIGLPVSNWTELIENHNRQWFGTHDRYLYVSVDRWLFTFVAPNAVE